MDVSFFIEMCWKSALIAGAALMLAYVLRSRAASDRALVLRIGVCMLLLLPLIALALPVLPIEAWSAPAAPSLPAAAEAAFQYLYVPGPEAQLPSIAAAGPQPALPTIWDDPTPLVLLAYLGGLMMVGGRLLLGLVLLRRWTRGAREVTCPDWLAAFERTRGGAGNDRLRLMVSDSVPSPLSWGWRRPVILVDPDTLAEPEEADAILAHEIAHVARRDWPALMLTRIAASLFWFNPLVWLLEREIVQQAEEAADCEAAAHVEPARYAQTLLSWAQNGGRALPANSIAPKGSALGRRIRAILDRRTRERPQGSKWTALAVILCIAIAAPVAAMQLVQAARAPAVPAPPAPPAAPRAPQAPDVPGAPGVPHAPDAPPAPPAPLADVPDIPDIPDVSGEVHAALAEVMPQIPEIVASAMASVDPEEIQRSVDEALREAGPELNRLSREDRERVSREVRRAVAGARAHAMAAARAQRAAAPEIAMAMREARRAVAEVRPMVRAGMAHGAEGMARGAERMEQGAQRMAEEAQRMRDPAYREQHIARERARGRTVTHQDLIKAADGMAEGAQGMREGAREMREAAQRMRSGGGD
jgi:beta-lactamase regulating signal transducer with metallopeptidase domain